MKLFVNLTHSTSTSAAAVGQKSKSGLSRYDNSHLFTFSCAATSQKHVPVRRRLRDQRGHRSRLLLHLQALRTQRNRHGVRSEGEQQLNICFCVFNTRRATAGLEGFWEEADDVLKDDFYHRYLSILHISVTM